MVLSIYFLSLLFFIFGWFYYSKPHKIQALNTFFRDKVFNDRNILIRRKKISVVFFVLACLLLSLAYLGSVEQRKAKSITTYNLDRELLFDVLSLYKRALENSPDNIGILAKSAHVYEVLGEKNRAAGIWKRIIALDPDNKLAAERLYADS